MRAHLRLGKKLLLASAAVGLTFQAAAQAPESDWIDEFPTVTTVAHAAFEELKVTGRSSTYDITRDDDQVAVNLVGTFVLMRRTAMYLYDADPSMSPEREERIRSIVAAYEEAELTIGRAATTRRGYITNATLGRGCRVGDLECYRRWFKNDTLNISGRAEYRERILARLFPCGDRGHKLYELHQSYGLRTPYMPSPAVTDEITPDLAGVAPVGCKVYGGDANRNGLCDDWERSSAPALGATPAVGAGCVPIGLLQVRLATSGGLRVTIDPKTAQAGQSVRFRVQRAAVAQGNSGAVPVWEQEATIQAAGNPAGPLYVDVATGTQLKTDGERPFLVVDTVAVRSRGPISCEQPLPSWLPRQLTPYPVGLHGPYGVGPADGPIREPHAGYVIRPGPGADAAAMSAASVALSRTAGNEAAFVILQDTRAPGRYYTTAPVAGPAAGSFAAGHIRIADYAYSVIRAFAGSCELGTHFKVAAFVHTHPVQYGGASHMNDDFSMLDFNSAVEFLAAPDFDFSPGLLLKNAYEGIYMINARTGCIRSFTAYSWDKRDNFSDVDQQRAKDVGSSCD